MSVSEVRDQIILQAQGAMALNIAFIGISNPLFSTLAETGKVTPEDLAERTDLGVPCKVIVCLPVKVWSR
ncbi:MAG: hypothetical protein HYU64_19570 [Armatimonadetes bacterium]|nr:hypothetical protein [Armatimonadota bacterium]